MSRLWLLYRIELRKLLARKVTWATLVTVVLVAFLSPWASKVMDVAAGLMGGGKGQDDYANGWTALAGAVGNARLFLVLVVLVLAGSSVAEETTLGTLKSVLVRPVRRVELLLAKLLAVWSFGAALLLLALAVGALAGELTLGLYDVVDPLFPTRVKYTHGEMAVYLYSCVFLTLLPLLALTALGLLASVSFEHAGHATGVAIASLFFFSALGGLSDNASDFVFTSYLAWPFEVFNDIANQLSGTTTKFERRVPYALVTPLVWTGLLFGLTAWSLQRRDVTGAG